MNPDSSPEPRTAGFPRWRLAVLLLYPALVYLALYLGRPELRALGLPLLAVLFLPLIPKPGGRVALLAITLALSALAILAPSLALWLPGLISILFGLFFASTLRANSTPLIARFAELAHQHNATPLPDGADAWLRGWTWTWAIVLVSIGLVALWLASGERVHAWLIWMAAATPLIMLATLCAELLLRRRVFPDDDHPGLLRFLIDIIRIQPHHFAR